MKCCVAVEASKPVSQQFEALERVDAVKSALQREMNVEAVEQLDCLINNDFPMLLATTPASPRTPQNP